MKLLVLKAISALVMLAGAVLCAAAAEYAPAQKILQYVLEPEFWLVSVGGALFFFGLYGILPAWRPEPLRSIFYEGEHGQVEIQLDPVQRTLRNVLSNLPEIKKIQVRVTPDGEARRANIHARCLLRQPPETFDLARTMEERVSAYLYETAKIMLGLEEIGEVTAQITGIDLDATKSVQYVQGKVGELSPEETERLFPESAATPAAAGLDDEAIAQAEQAALDARGVTEEPEEDNFPFGPEKETATEAEEVASEEDEEAKPFGAIPQFDNTGWEGPKEEEEEDVDVSAGPAMADDDALDLETMDFSTEELANEFKSMGDDHSSWEGAITHEEKEQAPLPTDFPKKDKSDSSEEESHKK